MFKKQNRLPSLRINAKNQTFDTSLFKIKIFSTGGEVLRFAFVVSKKIDKRAVVRNKTKRVLKKAAKRFLEKIAGGKDVVIFAKTKIEPADENIIAEALEQVFKKAKIIK